MRCAGSHAVLLRRFTAGLRNVDQVSLAAVFHMLLLKVNIVHLILNTNKLNYETYFSQTRIKYRLHCFTAVSTVLMLKECHR